MYCPKNMVLNRWLNKQKKFDVEVVLGLSGRKQPLFNTSFFTSLSYIDEQGEKWGDTYIKIIGQHFDDYSHWDDVCYLLPISGERNFLKFVPLSFSKRDFKGAAPGVTGLIGEVLVTIFFQKVLCISPFDMAHLTSNDKAPDFCLNIQPLDLFRCLNFRSNPFDSTIFHLIKSGWSYPLPVECKSRKSRGDRQARSAIIQLISYWKQIPQMAGYGIFAQIDIIPKTKLRLHLLIPKSNEILNVQKIISSNIIGTELPQLPQKPTVKQFEEIIGDRLIG